MPENIIQIDQNLPGTKLDRLITEKMTQILNAMLDAATVASVRLRQRRSVSGAPPILGDLFDRLGLRRIRAARLGQQPDRLRLELWRISRALCHDSVVPEKLRTLDRGRPWHDSQFASTRLSPSRDMSR